jgi:NADH-quinone oxidoreductase subunit L
MITWLVCITIVLPWLGALAVWIVGDQHPRVQHTLAIIFAVSTGLTSLLLPAYVSEEIVLRLPAGGIFGEFTLVADGLGVFLAMVAAVVGSLAVIFSADYMRGEAQLGRYYALVLLFIGAMAGLVLSGSLLLMFLFWEITAFCSYALISFHNDDPKAVAGGIKALIITSLGGVGLLAGAMIARANFGSYQINTFLEQAPGLQPDVLALIAFGFLIAAAAKSAQIPFQTWLPDAMEAPTPVTALIHAATMVNAGVYLLARFYPAFENVPGWTTAVIIVGLTSALLAAIMAVVSNDLKRALAYSTISQLGYMVYAIGTGAVFASQFHLLSHSLFKALLFLSAGAVIHTVGTRDMRQMGGLGKDMPFVRVVFVIGGLALAGLPIANGFFSKELVLENGLAHGPLWGYVGMVFCAGITALYTLRMVMMVFYGERRQKEHFNDAPSAMRVSLSVLSIGTLTSWLLAGPFADLMVESLPFHHLEGIETGELALEIITAPATWLALAIIALGFILWLLRDQFESLVGRMEPLATFAQQGLGFDWLNLQIVNLTKRFASALRTTHTGQLSWNVFGVIAGLVLVLAILTTGI